MSSNICKKISSFSLLLVILFSSSCSLRPDGKSEEIHLPSEPTQSPTLNVQAPDPLEPAHLSSEQVQTLRSIVQLDEYPLYRMRFYGGFRGSSMVPRTRFFVRGRIPRYSSLPRLAHFGCSLFAALGDPNGYLYGRNFDWRFSPAMILYTDPPDGYASLTMVDLEYLVGDENARRLVDLDLTELEPLLEAPQWPFDGMNEHGLVIGMAAVVDSRLPYDPEKPTIGSLEIMRQILDHAKSVSEAIEIIEQYNLDMLGGPWLHYLIADANGDAVLVEFYDGEMRLHPNEGNWKHATNFLQTTHQNDLLGVCPRYDKIERQMSSVEGKLDTDQALSLLEQVSQAGGDSGTQWSVVYDQVHREVLVVMGRDFEQVHRIPFELFKP